MSTVSDVYALYGAMRDTWAKVEAHITAHVILVVVVITIFLFFDGSFSTNVGLTASSITKNEWYKLARDTGMLFYFFVVPILVLSAYLALLRYGGQFLAGIVLSVLPPTRKTPYNLLTPQVLEPLALALGKSDFSFSDLQDKSSELMLRYQAQQDEQWEKYRRSISELTENALVYFGDFLVFAALWPVYYFKLLPSISSNSEKLIYFFWVLFILLALALFFRFRVSYAIAAVPIKSLINVSQMVRADPDMKAALDVSEETREGVRQRLAEILRTLQEHQESRPSLRRYLKHELSRLRQEIGLPQKKGEIEREKQMPGWPLQALYATGMCFSSDREHHTRYDSQWLKGYIGYRYYLLHNRVSALVSVIETIVQDLGTTGRPTDLANAVRKPHNDAGE